MKTVLVCIFLKVRIFLHISFNKTNIINTVIKNDNQYCSFDTPKCYPKTDKTKSITSGWWFF